MIPQWILDLPPLGNINVHASLLPKLRSSSIQWAIAEGETITGATTMKINAPDSDTGDILLKAELPIDPFDTAETLSPKLAAIGADLLVETLNKIQTIKPKPQDKTKQRWPNPKEDGKISFDRTADQICNRLRGSTLAGTPVIPWEESTSKPVSTAANHPTVNC